MRKGVVGGWLLVVSVGCGGGTPSQPQVPTDDSFARFTLRGAGYDTEIHYSTAGGGLIFCRRQAGRANYLWIRLAAERTADGANGPHIDMDLCNFGGSGAFGVVHDVRAGLLCDQGATWDLWWHGGPSKVFVSRPSSSPCDVAVTASGATLQGTFQCQGLTPESGNDRLDVLGGSFRCAYP